MSAQHTSIDVLIAGGGYVGLSLAVALKQADPAMEVAVVDLREIGQMERDPRASAIIAAASRMLDRLGVWDEILPQAQPMTEMIVTDSRLRDTVRPVFLTFDGDVEPGEPFAHMVPNGTMVGALARRAVALGVDLITSNSVTGFSVSGPGVEIRLGSGDTRHARLLVAADGVRSKLRDLAGIGVVRWDYDQSGIVTTVRHERPHNGRAEEHFLPAGRSRSCRWWGTGPRWCGLSGAPTRKSWSRGMTSPSSSSWSAASAIISARSSSPARVTPFHSD